MRLTFKKLIYLTGIVDMHPIFTTTEEMQLLSRKENNSVKKKPLKII